MVGVIGVLHRTPRTRTRYNQQQALRVGAQHTWRTAARLFPKLVELVHRLELVDGVRGLRVQPQFLGGPLVHLLRGAGWGEIHGEEKLYGGKQDNGG